MEKGKSLLKGNQGDHGNQGNPRGLSRRDFVKATSLGALGIGMVGSALAELGLGSKAEASSGRGKGRGSRKGKGSDKLFFGLSWTLTAIPEESEILECELRSHLDDSGHFHDMLCLRHRVVAAIERNPDCDQVLSDDTGDRLLPADTRLVMELEADLQLNGPGGTPIGLHRGEFMLVSDSLGALARGDVEGTEGLETHLPHGSADRCKAAGHDEGCLEGHLLLRQASSELKDADIRATFSSQIDPTHLTAALCQNLADNPWKGWKANLDGVIVGYHRPGHERARGEQERGREQEL